MGSKRGILRRAFIRASGGALTLAVLRPRAARAPRAVAPTTPDAPRSLPAAGVAARRPVTLPPRMADVTIRWRHIEPKAPAAGLQAAWTFDEGSGYLFRDVSGRGHTAYVTGTRWNTTDSGLTASLHRAGQHGGAIYLNGARWLQVRHAPALDNGGRLTVSAWLKPDRPPAAMASQAIVQKLHDNRGYGLLLGDEGAIRFVVRDDRGHEHAVVSTPGVLREGRWTHIVGTADAATGHLRLYADGAPAGSGDGVPFVPGDTTADLMIGRAAARPDAFMGYVDEVTMHDRALGPADVARLYVVGLPALYTQSRETIDARRGAWTAFKGNAPIPHPIEPDTVFTARFNGSFLSDQGHAPLGLAGTGIATDARPLGGAPGGAVPPGDSGAAPTLAPGRFGGAYDATAHTGLAYPSPLASDRGTFEAWFIPVADPADPDRRDRKPVFRAEGAAAWLELYSGDRRWMATLGAGGMTLQAIGSVEQAFAYDSPVHLAVTWGPREGDGRRDVALYLNGVEVARAPIGGAPTTFDRRVTIGGAPGAPAHGYVDDVRISDTVRGWGAILPRGHVATETSALDLMDRFDHAAGEPVMLWRPGSAGSDWRYSVRAWEDGGARTGDAPEARRSLYQGASRGFHPAFHPDAYGHMSSIEAGTSFEAAADGWAGVFVQAPSGPEPGAAFGGYSFAINPATNRMRLAVHRAGAVVASKTLPYDFPLAVRKTYTLTLSSIDDGVLRGYVDGQSMIALATAGRPPYPEGHAGLFTEGVAAHFSDAHFSALTPSTEASRLIQQRVFADGQSVEDAGGYANLSLNAFRWSKRYGLLPWRRTYRDPQPPGFISTGDKGVAQPNRPAFWRSKDSANPLLLTVGGTVLLVQRGNPYFAGMPSPDNPNGVAGGAALGLEHAPAALFDGIHFADPNVGIASLDKSALLRGHRDMAPPAMKNPPPLDERFQVNDQGGAYVGGRRVLVFAREFRNVVGQNPWYRRLVYALVDVGSLRWDRSEPHYVSWSAMDPNDPTAIFSGLDGTPALAALRDPATDAYAVFLFHQFQMPDGTPTTGITGLRFDKGGKDIALAPRYPTRGSYTKPNGDVTYGEGVIFDNGIYYLHYNSATGKIIGDWPDRLALAASLHPYKGPWTNSADSYDPHRAYFERGAENDYDNAAIWSGKLFKHRGRYYLYYEGFHASDDPDQPYENYDNPQNGSSVGFATAN